MCKLPRPALDIKFFVLKVKRQLCLSYLAPCNYDLALYFLVNNTGYGNLRNTSLNIAKIMLRHDS